MSDWTAQSLGKKVIPGRTVTVDTLPLCAFTAHNWNSMFDNLYEKAHGSPPVHEQARAVRAIQFATNVESRVFLRRRWSAREFAFFLRDMVGRKDSLLTLQSFRRDRNYDHMEGILDRADGVFRDKRNGIPLEGMVYAPHVSLAIAEGDLMRVFDEIGQERVAAILYNYGISNYVRMVEMQSDRDLSYLSCREASYIARKRIFNLYNSTAVSSPLVAAQLFAGIFRSTILWEPIPEMLLKDGASSIVDWRADYGKIVEKHGFARESWWRSKDETMRRRTIEAVRKFFQRGKRGKSGGL